MSPVIPSRASGIGAQILRCDVRGYPDPRHAIPGDMPGWRTAPVRLELVNVSARAQMADAVWGPRPRTAPHPGSR